MTLNEHYALCYTSYAFFKHFNKIKNLASEGGHLARFDRGAKGTLRGIRDLKDNFVDLSVLWYLTRAERNYFNLPETCIVHK